MKFLIPLLAGCLFLGACQKASNDAPANAANVSMTVRSPQPGTLYRTGDTLRVSADVTYPTELHGYEIDLTDSATGVSIWNVDAHVHDDHFSISEAWVDTLRRPATLLCTLTVEIDHDGHAADTVIRLRSQP